MCIVYSIKLVLTCYTAIRKHKSHFLRVFFFFWLQSSKLKQETMRATGYTDMITDRATRTLTSPRPHSATTKNLVYEEAKEDVCD